MKKKDILRHRTKRDQSRIPYQVNVGMSFFVCKIYYYEGINFLAVGFACDVINLLQKLFTFSKKVFSHYTHSSVKMRSVLILYCCYVRGSSSSMIKNKETVC